MVILARGEALPSLATRAFRNPEVVSPLWRVPLTRTLVKKGSALFRKPPAEMYKQVARLRLFHPTQPVSYDTLKYLARGASQVFHLGHIPG